MFSFAPCLRVPAIVLAIRRRYLVIVCRVLLVVACSIAAFGMPKPAIAQSESAFPSGLRRGAPSVGGQSASRVVPAQAEPDSRFDEAAMPGYAEQSNHAEPPDSAYQGTPDNAALDNAADYADEPFELMAADEPVYEIVDEPDAWYESHPDSTEPLGFADGHLPTAAPNGAVHTERLLGEGYAPIHEPMDLHAPAPAVSSGEWLRDGFWYTEQSAVYINRSAGVRNSIILGIEFQATVLPEENPRLDIRPGIGWEPGLRSMIGRRIGRDCRNRDHSIEFTYLGLTHWHAAGGLQALGGNGIFTPIDPTLSVPAFNGSSLQTYDLTSDFNSWELNYRITRRLERDQVVYTRDSTWVRRATPGLLPSLYAGVRVVSINEHLAWFAESDNPVSTGNYFVRTHNNMVGPQLGLDVFYERTNWRGGVRVKGAAVVNWAAQSTQVTILDSNGQPLVPSRDESANVHDAAFVGELGFVGAYHIRPNFALRASWDLMWVTNLALAQNQLTFNPATPVEIANSNTLFFQGLGFGFELTR